MGYRCKLINLGFPIRYFDQLGVPRLARDLNSTNRPVRTRTPGGVGGAAGVNSRAPIPIRRTSMLMQQLFWWTMTGIAAARTIARRGSLAGSYQTFWPR